MDVKQVIGGYIVAENEEEGTTQRVFVSLEEVFDYMLLQFERRCKKFNNPLVDSFGAVTINRNPSDVKLDGTYKGLPQE